MGEGYYDFPVGKQGETENKKDCKNCENSKDYGLGWFSMHKCGICGEEFGCCGFSMEFRDKGRGETTKYETVCPVCQGRIFKTVLERSMHDRLQSKCVWKGRDHCAAENAEDKESPQPGIPG